jgi:hypothetical protein
MAARPATLEDVTSWANAEEISLIDLLLSEDQGHLFAGWKVGADVDAKRAFCAQVRIAPKSPRYVDPVGSCADGGAGTID